MQRGLGLERNDGVLQRFIREATHTRQHKKQNKIDLTRRALPGDQCSNTASTHMYLVGAQSGKKK